MREQKTVVAGFSYQNLADNQQIVDNYVKLLADLSISLTTLVATLILQHNDIIDLILNLIMENKNAWLQRLQILLQEDRRGDKIDNPNPQIVIITDFQNRINTNLVALGKIPIQAPVILIVQTIITEVLDNPYAQNLTNDQKTFVVQYHTTALRNIIAIYLGHLPMPMPYPDVVTAGIKKAVSVIYRNYKNFMTRFRIPTEKTIEVPVEKVIPTPRSGFLLADPGLHELGGAFDKKTAELLKKSQLGQSPEVTARLAARRQQELRTTMPLTYVTDVKGASKPKFPSKVTSSLLPFVIVANFLLQITRDPTDGSPSLSGSLITKIHQVDSIMDLVLTMSESKRILADNLEMTFKANNFGYFIEPKGLKAVERIAALLEDMPKWTNQIAGMTTEKFNPDKVSYIERAMISVHSALSAYCEVCLPDSAGVCGYMEQFLVPPVDPKGKPLEISNVTRFEALSQILDEIRRIPGSILTKPLSSLLTVINPFMKVPAFMTRLVDSINVDGKVVKAATDETSALRRAEKTLKQIDALLSPFDPTDLGRTFSAKLIDKLLELLTTLRSDLTTEANANAPATPAISKDLLEVASDIATAISQLEARQQDTENAPRGMWEPAKKLNDPYKFLPDLIPASGSAGLSHLELRLMNLRAPIIQLYRILFSVISGNIAKRQGFFSRAPTPASRGSKITPLPGNSTVEQIIKFDSMKRLPPLIDATILVNAIKHKTGAAFPTDANFYNVLSQALNDVYGGITVEIPVNYQQIADRLSTAITTRRLDRYIFGEFLIGDPLMQLVTTLNGGIHVSLSKVDFLSLGILLYVNHVSPRTQDLAQAVVSVANFLRDGNVVDIPEANKLIKKRFGKQSSRITSGDLAIDLVASTLKDGVFSAGPLLQLTSMEQQNTLQRRLAEALTKTPVPRGLSPPTWTGVMISS